MVCWIVFFIFVCYVGVIGCFLMLFFFCFSCLGLICYF